MGVRRLHRLVLPTESEPGRGEKKGFDIWRDERGKKNKSGNVGRKKK
jgi:hypothetical protein